MHGPGGIFARILHVEQHLSRLSPYLFFSRTYLGIICASGVRLLHQNFSLYFHVVASKLNI